jgi:hypothetical protein
MNLPDPILRIDTSSGGYKEVLEVWSYEQVNKHYKHSGDSSNECDYCHRIVRFRTRVGELQVREHDVCAHHIHRLPEEIYKYAIIARALVK